ncbi:MAG: LD-carboxypeptidase [Bacteroidales bacterium]|jgi:muramoyltetrapeptide carboxypeptidase|nr:LD-carboxypeptidase [Bacteroidales bacterium]
MIIPPYLKEGDQIGLVSPAKKISINEIKAAIRMFQHWGLEPVFGQHLFAQDNQLAGNDESRAADIQSFLDNPEIKAIISTRGGYGSVRIIDKLNFDLFKRFPKWLIGYSDITVFHSHLNVQLKIESLHATMPLNFPMDGKANSATESLRKALFGTLDSYTFKHKSVIRAGNAMGELIGGNLSILFSLMGSDSEMNFDRKILFIEELDEYLYHIDRMLMNLKRAGKLKSLAGLIVGGMSNMKDNDIPFGKNAEEIIVEHVGEYKFPVVFGFPAGHIEDNRALILGRKVSLKTDFEESSLFFV